MSRIEDTKLRVRFWWEWVPRYDTFDFTVVKCGSNIVDLPLCRSYDGIGYDTSLYYWTEGNNSCDSNRAIEFGFGEEFADVWNGAHVCEAGVFITEICAEGECSDMRLCALRSAGAMKRPFESALRSATMVRSRMQKWFNAESKEQPPPMTPTVQRSRIIDARRMELIFLRISSGDRP